MPPNPYPAWVALNRILWPNYSPWLISRFFIVLPLLPLCFAILYARLWFYKATGQNKPLLPDD